MLELWKLRHRRKSVYNAYERDIKSAIKRKSPTEEQYVIEAQQWSEVREIDKLIDQRVSDRLLQQIRDLDLEIPPPDESEGEEFWSVDERISRTWLAPRGRLEARKLIDNEKSRRFQAKTKWATLLLPIITALAGLIGVITGLVAVLKK